MQTQWSTKSLPLLLIFGLKSALTPSYIPTCWVYKRRPDSWPRSGTPKHVQGKVLKEIKQAPSRLQRAPAGETFELKQQQEKPVSKHDSVTKRKGRPKSEKCVDYTARTMAVLKHLSQTATVNESQSVLPRSV